MSRSFDVVETMSDGVVPTKDWTPNILAGMKESTESLVVRGAISPNADAARAPPPSSATGVQEDEVERVVVPDCDNPVMVMTLRAGAPIEAEEYEEIARDEPKPKTPPPELPKKLGAEISLSIRIGKGELAKRGTYTVNTFETVFITRHSKGNSVYAPKGVCRSASEFSAFRDAFRLLNRTGAVIKSDFPKEVAERDDLQLSSAEQLKRLLELQAWTSEMLTVFATLPKAQKRGARETVFDFFDVCESRRDTEQSRELKAILREKLIDGDFIPPSSDTSADNARFAKNAKPSLKPRRKFDIFADERIKANHFEYRYDNQSDAFFLYNPYSGETILDAAPDGVLDRHKSHWRLPEPFPDRAPPDTQHQQLYPVFFASRLVAARPVPAGGFFNGLAGRAAAALVLTAAARGMIARARMQKLLAQRYHKMLDKSTKQLYFANLVTHKSKWTKPRLAGTFTIKEPPLDLRNDTRTEQSSYCDGPVYKRRGGKGTFERCKPFSPTKIVDERLPTEREPDMIDLENTPFRVLVLWVEANVDKFELYAPLKELYGQDDWETLQLIMDKRRDDTFCQMYCSFAFSRMCVGPEGGIYADTKNVMEYLHTRLVEWHKTLKYGCNQMLFAANALLTILQHHAARLEFLSTKHVDNKASTELSGDAEAFLEDKVNIFCKLLRQIPVELYHEQMEKGFMGKVTELAKPTLAGIEMAELVLQIVGALLHERDTREVVGETLGPFVIYALRVCNAEAFVLQYGLRCFYNSMYMCRLGWEALVWRTDLLKLLEEIKVGPMGGDWEVQRDLRRVELSCEEQGWAGHVEQRIEKEMTEDRAGFIDAFRSKENSPVSGGDLGSPQADPLLSPSPSLSPSRSPSHFGSPTTTTTTTEEKRSQGQGAVWEGRPGTVMTPATMHSPQSQRPPRFNPQAVPAIAEYTGW